jgi:hypothetical protein
VRWLLAGEPFGNARRNVSERVIGSSYYAGSACLKQWKLSSDVFAERRCDASCCVGVTCCGAREMSVTWRVSEGGQGRPQAARRGSLDGPVITGIENG